jgi:hypothetical protein
VRSRWTSRRGPAPEVPVGPGERVLAWCTGSDEEVLAGTRDALYLVVGGQARRVPWEEVESAHWDQDSDLLRVAEMGAWGERRPEHAMTVTDPGRLLELLRERVSASVVLQRHVPVSGRRGFRVIARRAPRGDRPLQWFFEYDAGVDPEDPDVRSAAEAALSQARQDVGAS